MIICRECSTSDILGYPGDDAQQAICEACCSKTEHPDGEVGHQYIRDGGEWYCKYCTALATHDWLADHYSD